MNKSAYITSRVFCFSRWSRKSYSIFASLGKNVKISRLSVNICGKALLKLHKLSMFLYQDKVDSLSNGKYYNMLKYGQIPKQYILKLWDKSVVNTTETDVLCMNEKIII